MSVEKHKASPGTETTRLNSRLRRLERQYAELNERYTRALLRHGVSSAPDPPGPAAERAEDAAICCLIDNAPAFLFTADATGNVDYTNAVFTRLTGMTSAAALGTGWMSCVHPEDTDQVRRIWTEGIKSGGPIAIECRLRGADERYRWFLSRAVPVRDPIGTVVRWAGIGVDIHQQKSAVETLKHHAEELEHFAYASSHDLQEPLRTVVSCAQLLDMRYQERLDDDAREILGFIRSAAERMRSLLRELLAYSRLVNDEPSRFQLTDATMALQIALKNMAPLIRSAAARVEHGRLPEVLANANQLVQVFQNLISNAVRYRREGEPPLIRIHAHTQGHDIVFSVNDNGIGIKTEYQERIFGLFKRLHGRDHPGAGVGLTICRKIVERHGGRIWVRSEPGVGSTFYFTMRSADVAQ